MEIRGSCEAFVSRKDEFHESRIKRRRNLQTQVEVGLAGCVLPSFGGARLSSSRSGWEGRAAGSPGFSPNPEIASPQMNAKSQSEERRSMATGRIWQPFSSGIRARTRLSLAFPPRAPKNNMLFESQGCVCIRSLQFNVREPRENRGRLRHCNGLQTPTATGRKIGKAGARFEARSQDTGLIALVMAPLARGRLLRQREG